MSLAERNEYYLKEHTPNSPQEEKKIELKPVEKKEPANKVSILSRLEKVIGVSFVIALLVLSIATIKLTTAVNKEEEAISVKQQKIGTSKKEVNRLEQEKNELLRQDRVKDIAEKSGIKLHEDSIRTIRE